MKQKLIVLFLLIASYTYSQDKEFGLMIGTTHYLGDLTETPIKLRQTKFSTGFLFRYYFNPHIDLKVNLFYGNLQGADSNKPGKYDPVLNEVYDPGKWAKFRNLSFKSYILDISVMVEYNILPYVAGNDKNNWTPYISTGISVFNFNPRTKYKGEWYDLQPLGTEGQGTTSEKAEPKYKLTSIAIPYGLGVKYSFKHPKGKSKIDLYTWNIGFEVCERKTFTDHLDDVGGYYPDYDILRAARGADGDLAVALSDRQPEALGPLERPGDAVPYRTSNTVRGDPNDKDHYLWLGFTISKTFRTRTCIAF